MRKRGNYQFLGNFSWYLPGVGGMFALLAWMLLGALLGGMVIFVLTITLGGEFVSEYGSVISYPLMFIPPMLYASSKSAANAMSMPGVKLDSNHFAPLGALQCVLLVTVGTLAMGFWTDGIVNLLPPMPPALEQTLKSLTSGNFWLNLLAVSIFAPICEEWLCRGMVLRGLLRKTRMKPVWAIIVSALFFALIHMNPWQAIPAFLLGCLFGWVYYRTGSLKLTMLMHFVNNTFALIIGHIDSLKDMESWMDLMPRQQYYLISAACFLLTVLVVLAFRRIPLKEAEGNSDAVPSIFDNTES